MTDPVISDRGRLRSAIGRYLRRMQRGRGISIRADDRLIVSYPKSGNTWMRYLIANLLRGPVDFSTLESVVPDIYLHRDRDLAGMPSPRVLKSHEPYDPRYRRLVYLVRDPRSVFLSYFEFKRKYRMIPEHFGHDDFLEEYLEGDQYGPWDEHILSWTATRGARDGFVLVRYEDLLSDTRGSLLKVVAVLFPGMEFDDERIDGAVARSSFDSMKRDESVHTSVPMLSGSDRSIPFMRSGRAAAWRDRLDRTVVARIEKRFRKTMVEFGYIG